MNNNEISCLLCGGSAKLKYDRYPGYQEPDTFRIYHCPHCNTAFPLPKTDTSVIYENIYKNADKVPGYNRYWRYAQFIKEFSNPFEYLSASSEPYWGVKEALSLFSNDKKPKILEIGSGLGYLTYSLIKANYNIVGMDVSNTAVKQAKEIFGDHYICGDLFEYARLNEDSFDVVILTEVIEHIDNPVEFIASIMKLLKSSGIAIITTPNKSFFPEDIIWASDLPPVHYWWFSEESMKFIANILNINISFINFKNFYKKNYKVIGLKSQRNGYLPNPFFNKDGELIAKVARSKKSLKLRIQILIDKIPFGNLLQGILIGRLKMIFGKSRELFENDLIVCREKGIVMCTIMQKRPS
jgi:2-polyprenyl-3-methyl-5-hydroxy-6-metoxy-1,4-benzoquinol methylase